MAPFFSGHGVCIVSPVAQFKVLFVSIGTSNQKAAVDSRGGGSGGPTSTMSAKRGC